MLRIDDDNRKWWILSAMGAVGGVILLDETVVGVALPTIREHLAMSSVASHWIVSAYLLVFTGFAAAGGKIGDVIGLRTAFVVSMAIFGLSSLAAGFAPDGAWLIAARALQGLGAAVIFPASFAMVTVVFPKEQRGMAIGILAAGGTVFLAAGPLVGGFLTEIFSWRWIFWVNGPIVVLITLIVSAAWVDAPRRGARPSIDYGGVLMLVAGLGMLVFAAMQADDWGWTRPVILALLAGGLVVLALFVLIERRRAEPLIEVDLFRNATFSACNLMLLTAQFGKITVFVFVALYLQHALKMSPLTAGLALMVAVVGIPVMAAPAGRIADRFGARRPALAGQALATVAMLWVGFASAWDSYGWLVPGLVLWGIALPFCFMPVQREIMNAVPVEQQGQAGGIIVTVRLLGGTLGMAACSTVFAMTDDFQIVFLATGGFMLTVLLVGWLAIERQDSAHAS